MTDAERAVKKRQGVKRKFDMRIASFEHTLKAKPTLEQVKEDFDLVKERYSELMSIHEDLIDTLTEENVKDDVFELHEDWIEDVQKQFADIRKRFNEFTAQNTPSPSPPTTKPSSVDRKSNLERIPLPEFNGDIRFYPTWKKQFKESMKQNSQSPYEELARLIIAVQPPLRDEIRMFSSAALIWQYLEERYGDKQSLIDILIKDLKTMKPLKGKDPQSIRLFTSRIRSFIMTMEDLGEGVEAQSRYVFADVLAKLEPDDRCDYGNLMVYTKQPESIDTLLGYLETQAKLRTSVTYTCTDKDKRRTINSADVNPKEESTCTLGCAQNHGLADCPIFKGSNDKWSVIKQGGFCGKCLKRHDYRNCDKTCSVTGCSRYHHSLLHRDRPTLNPFVPPFQPTSTTQTTTGAVKVYSLGSTHLPVQLVNVRNAEGDPIKGLAMIDSGSNQTLIRKEFAQKLGLSGDPTKLRMKVAGGGTRCENSTKYAVNILSADGRDLYDVSCLSLKKVCQGVQALPKEDLKQYPHLTDIEDDVHVLGGPVDLLIGADFVEAHRDLESRVGGPGEPIAKKNIFGWMLLGKFSDGPPTVHHIELIDSETVSTLDDIKKLVQQDQIGIKPTRLCVCSDNELRESSFIKHVRDTTRILDDGRVEVKMPWKPGQPNLQNNWSVAYDRMGRKEKQLRKKGTLEVVNKEIQDLLDRKVVIKLAPERVIRDEPAWYLPLNVVEQPEKTTKLRIVFDSAATYRGMSLNDALEKGPCYLNSLFDVLVGWRAEAIAFAGDIAKMFNQVALHPVDQPFHRFMWRDGEDREPDIYQWVRLSFGDRPAPDLAISAVNLLADRAGDQHPQAAQILKSNVYMDDIAASRPETEEVANTIRDVNAILSSGQFSIKKWHSNDSSIDDDRDDNPVNLLGHKWDKVEDRFRLKKQALEADLQTFTKRKALGLLAQLWDPLGLIGPVTIKYRIHLQELWAAGYDWDQELPPEEVEKWICNLRTMNQVLRLDYDRRLKPENAIGDAQLHGFSDGGESGYGASVFIRWECSDGSFAVRCVASKPLVAPLKKKTIPRLELMGCVATVRLTNEIERALKIQPIKHFWCDSTTALSWIRAAPREFKPFVSVRIAEIQESYPKDRWRYIASEHNPADALTRGIESEQLMQWHEGPAFLKQPEGLWPDFLRERIDGVAEQVCDDAERKTAKPKGDECGTEERISVHVISRDESRKSEEAKLKEAKLKEGQILVLERLLDGASTFRKVRKLTAALARAVKFMKTKEAISGPFEVSELLLAEECLWKMCQGACDLQHLSVQGLEICTDEAGLLRAKGRLECARSLPREIRNPVILTKHPLVRLFMTQLHQELMHCGYKRLMAEMQQRFWMLGLRDMAKSVVKTCMICRKMKRKVCEQQMGQLPNQRTSPGEPAFSNTALDFFGPFEIKVARKSVKDAWCCIFTCMTSRAVHLELCTDKTSDTFLMAFRRFASLRGHPRFIWSDRGTNFVGAQAYLREMIDNWDEVKIKTALADDFGTAFDWQWNIPRASHMNGVVESLIKSVRRALEASCRMVAYTEEQWRTFLSETAYVINSRPLYLPSDKIWEDPPVTPNDLVMGPHYIVPQPGPDVIVNPRDLNRSVQKRVNEFWRLWIRYYAPELLARSKWFSQQANLGVGDLVLERDPNARRGRWGLYVVESVYPGEDGLVRKAAIRNARGVYERPAAKLCLIATKAELESGLNDE